MTRTTTAALRRRLRRLDAGSLARFVAALWAAQGWSTSVRDGRVVARRHDPEAERRVLVVLSGQAAVAGALVRPLRDADLLVAPVGPRTARALAARTGLAVVDAAALHERLTYGVPADAREHLLRTVAPASGRAPDRRAVLSGLAVGLSAVGVGGLTPLPPTPPIRTSRLESNLGTNDRARSGTGELEGPPDPPGGELSPRATAVPRANQSCDDGPRRVIIEQLTTLRLELRARSIPESGSSRQLRYPDLGLPATFVNEVKAADMAPFYRARAVRTAPADRDGDRATVGARVVTEAGERVGYEFALRRTSGGCWRTDDVRVVGRGDP